ncbi:MAG: hypothetical protein HY481_01515 [Candidatus Vogelbacteria bacterium]|nr:hypothetical protein [Candidatus Vogelbacteria bacterium]
MSKVSNFSFIHDGILRENLDITFDHLLELLSLSESPDYTDTLKSSFRKTVIIYTASIIEALLLWVLKENKTEDELSKKQTVFRISKVIYKINETEQIVLGKNKIKIEKSRFEKLNLDQINSLCKDHGLISKDVFGDIDKVRTLRNRLHISTLKVIEKDYSKTDLEFVFSVASEIKNLAKRQEK